MKDKIKYKIIGLVICIVFGALLVLASILNYEYERNIDINCLLAKEILNIFFNEYMLIGLVVGGILMVLLVIYTLGHTNKAEGKFCGSKVLIVIVLFVIITIVCYLLMPSKYCIEGDNINHFEQIYLLAKDCVHNETIEIQTDNFKVESEEYRDSNNSGGYTYTYEYYVNIDDKYIIPIPNYYAKEMGQLSQSEEIHTFTVYKNSYIITQVDGIQLQELYFKR